MRRAFRAGTGSGNIKRMPSALLFTHCAPPTQEGVAAEQVAEGLARLGYALEPTEVARLLEAMHEDGLVKKSGFLASQIDWSSYQVDFRWVFVLSGRQCALAQVKNDILNMVREPAEVTRLLEAMRADEEWWKHPGFLASQIDWSSCQVDFRWVFVSS